MSEVADELTDLDRQLEQRDFLGVRKLIHEGMDIEVWLSGTVGRAIVKRAKEELVEGLEQLRTVDPTDAKAVMKAQMACAIPGAVLAWIAEAHESCKNAERDLIAADESRG